MARPLTRIFVLGAACLAALALGPRPVQAGPVLDRVRAEGVVRCGAEERPGFAAIAADGRISGLAVDLCRAAAIAVLGPDGRVAFRLYAASTDFDAVRDGTDDVSFLSGGAIADQALAPAIVPGPNVFFDQFSVMVPKDAKATSLADLGGKTICLRGGGPAQRTLEAALARTDITLSRLAFGEGAEMLDAYNGGRCEAIAESVTRLADMRRATAVNRKRSRIFAEPLALDPVFAATGTADGAWSAAVFWLLHALILGDAPDSPWRASGADALPLQEPALGLRPEWRRDVRAALGGYAEMVRRSLGDASPLRLPPGPNAPWPAGLLTPPAAP